MSNTQVQLDHLELIIKDLEKEHKELHEQLEKNQNELSFTIKRIKELKIAQCIEKRGAHHIYDEEDSMEGIWNFCEYCPYRERGEC